MPGDADNTRTRITDAARGVFSIGGFDAARMRDVATAAGINNERVYAYFGSKEMLFVAAVEEAVRRLAAACADHDDPTAWYEAIKSNIEDARLVVWAGMGDPEGSALMSLAGGDEDRAATIARALSWVPFPRLGERVRRDLES
jgi:AcrR family transcriptional regulator